jgi:signal transduction histidine kinase
VELRAELTPDIPDVEADEAQIQQLILNLVINAGEAIPGSGAITIRTGTGHLAEAQAIEECHAELSSGDYVVIEVADTGSGMDAETRSRIFDPFFSTKFTGRGLGLAAVAGIARSHGGAVQVSSEPGRGSTFRVLLPAVSRPVASQPASARPVSAQRSR